MGALEFRLPALQPSVSDAIAVEFDPGSSNVLWTTMARGTGSRCQNFSMPLLHAMRDMLRTTKETSARWCWDGQMLPIHYAVLRSGNPDYFSQGGDLPYFRSCIARKDRDALLQYSRLCLEIMSGWATGFSGEATTIALVQGRALGGGFEAALSADYLIAEEHSEFGFPEILFGLFPCTGGMSLLARRVGVYDAERMMTDGRIYTAVELKEMGVVDVICPKDEGHLATKRFIAGHAKHRTARLALQRSRHRLARLDERELLAVVDEWVDAAMGLGESDLRVMDALIRMQQNA